MTTEVLDPPESTTDTDPAVETPVAETTPAEVPAAEKPSKRLTCTKREKAILGIAKRLGELSPVCNGAEAEYLEAKGIADSLKKKWEGLQLQLQKVCTELATVQNGGDFQPDLFTNQSVPEPHRDVHEEGAAFTPDDEGGARDLDCLTRTNLVVLCGDECTAEGLTESKIELIRQACEGNTIADLEAMQRNNPNWNRDIKGFGEKWIDRLQDAHLAIRTRFPIPTMDSTDPATAPEAEPEAAEAGTVLDGSTEAK